MRTELQTESRRTRRQERVASLSLLHRSRSSETVLDKLDMLALRDIALKDSLREIVGVGDQRLPIVQIATAPLAGPVEVRVFISTGGREGLLIFTPWRTSRLQGIHPPGAGEAVN